MDNFTAEEWKEWVGSSKAKTFIKKIRERRGSMLEDLSTLTDPETLVKDYFIRKGRAEGLLDAIDLMFELIGDEK